MDGLIFEEYELCHTDVMETWLPFIALAGLMIGLFAWLRTDIRTLGERLDKRIDEQGKDIKTMSTRLSTLEQTAAALKATVETYFRVRVDRPMIPPDPQDKAA